MEIQVERTFIKTGLFILAAVFVIQGFIFKNIYNEGAYASEGVIMEQDTYLYTYDELTVYVNGGSFEDLYILKNGVKIIRNITEPYTFTVRENDLIEILAETRENSAEVSLSLKNGVFDEKYYVDLFDFSGGRVTVGRFVNKSK